MAVVSYLEERRRKKARKVIERDSHGHFKKPVSLKRACLAKNRKRDAQGHFLKGYTRKNPIPVNKTYAKRRQLQKKLTRNYDECIVKTAKKISGKRRKKYCAGVAWKMAKASGRFRDYPASKETGSMKRSRRKSKIARGRARNRKGHFIKGSHAAAPRKRHRRATHRRHTTHARALAETKPRRRRHRRHHAADWKGQPRRHAKAARKGWRHRRRGSAAPRRRRGKARCRTRTVTKVVYRNRPKKRSKRGGGRRMMKAGPEYIGAESYALENPLDAGEIAFVFVVGGLGYAAADLLGRFLNTMPVAASSNTTAVPIGGLVANDVATLIMPNWKSLAAQAGLVAVSGLAAYYIHAPMGRASAQGAMIGAGLHLFGDVFKALMAQFTENTALGQQLYLAEIEARNAGALTAAATAAQTTGSGVFSTGTTAVTGSTISGGTGTLSGLPLSGVGRPAVARFPPNPCRPPIDVGPRATPAGVGQLQVPAQNYPMATPPPQNPAAVGQSVSSVAPAAGNGQCVPCTSGPNLQETYRAAMHELQTGCGLRPDQMFPEGD